MKLTDCVCDNGKLPNHDAGKHQTCYRCKGFGKSHKNGYGSYKTQSAADRFGITCNICDGTGIWINPDTVDCYECSFYNRGIVVADAHVGDILPDEIGICGRIPDEVMATLVSEFNFIVVRDTSGLSWGEAHLGLNSVWSCVDYGRAWESNDDEALIAKVKEGFNHEQWIKITVKETRKICDTIAIKLTPNGYSVVSLATLKQNYSLPPTYTDEVLSAKI